MFIIAIDGPAGSGKSTTAKRVASALGYYHLDTGAMYRAVTLLALESLPGSAEANQTDALTVAAREISRTLKLEFCRERDSAGGAGIRLRLMLGERDITEQIRSSEVSSSVSAVAAEIEVRRALVQRQREFAERFKNVVAEGRDIGTVVFPEADLKVYLDADLNERARRRTLEMNENGLLTNIEEQKEKIAQRDSLDSSREASPLTQANDAVRVDTSGMSVDEQVEAVLRLVRERQSIQSGN